MYYNLVLCDPGLSSGFSGAFSLTEASAIITESVERLVILCGVRPLRSVGFKGSLLFPVWVCGRFLIGEEVSISWMNAGLTIPAEEIRGQYDAEIIFTFFQIQGFCGAQSQTR